MKTIRQGVLALVLATSAMVNTTQAASESTTGMDCPPYCLPASQDPLQREGFAVRLAAMDWITVGELLLAMRDADITLPAPTAPGTPQVVDQFGRRVTNRAAEVAAAAARAGFDVPPDLEEDHFARMFSEGQPPTSAAEALSKGEAAALDGRYEVARALLQKALVLGGAQQQRAKAVALANLGAVQAVLGNYQDARKALLKAVDAFHALPPPAVPQPVIPAAVASNPYLMRAWQYQNPMKTGRPPADAWAPLCELRTMLNLANLEGQLSQYTQADDWFDRAARLAGELGTRYELAKLSRWVALERSVLLRRAGRTADADASLRSATSGTPFDVLDDAWLGSRPLPLGASAAPVATAPRYSRAPTLEDAIHPGSGPHADTRVPEVLPNRNADAALARLQAEADAAEWRGDVPAALAASQRMAMLAAISANAERERNALVQAARLEANSGALDAAIYLGKRSVNAIQQARASLDDMDRPARQRYLTERRQAYLQLAGWLFKRQRLAECEQVLHLLKEDEGQDIPPAREASRMPAHGQLVFSVAEAAVLARHDALRDGMRALCREHSCGSLGLFPVEIRDLERTMHGQLDMTERALQMLERGPQGPGSGRSLTFDQTQLAKARAAVRKSASARSSEEAALVEQAAEVRDMFEGALAGVDASLRALRKQAPLFGDHFTSADMARIDALLTRLSAIVPLWHAPFTFMDGIKAQHAGGLPAGPIQAALAAMFTGGTLGEGLGDSLLDWKRLTELEELDSKREQLDASLASLLSDSRPTATPRFAPKDEHLLGDGRRILAQLPSGTVEIHLLPGATGLDALVVSRIGYRAFHQEFSPTTLSGAIDAVETALRDPNTDPTAACEALYHLVFEPLEGALREAGARTLMLAVDGPLRYLPFAALHDGRDWLVRRFAFDVYTSGAAKTLTRAPARGWRAAAFGNSTGGAGLGALPAVREELEAVVNDPRRATHGALSGAIWLDGDFTRETLRAVVAAPTPAERERPNLIHIASHFVLQAEDAGSSRLLLGDGSSLTLADLAHEDWRFDRFDLVTLSACETARSGADRFGQELEGLGNLLQGQGAAAVLATLWSVNDRGTADMMRRFYRDLAATPHVSKAEALRRAQMSMLDGTLAQATSTAGGRSTAARGADPEDPPGPSRPASDRRYMHPYYWAPFVLMGNWL